MACVAAVVEYLDPDEIVVQGDWLDAGGFSRHGPHSFADGAHDFLEAEVGPCNEMLDVLQGPDDRKLVYLEGNHEERVNRWLVSNAGKVGPSLSKLSSPERLLRWRVDGDGTPGARRKGFRWIPYLGKDTHSHYRIAPDLVAIHGSSAAPPTHRTTSTMRTPRPLPRGYPSRATTPASAMSGSSSPRSTTARW